MPRRAHRLSPRWTLHRAHHRKYHIHRYQLAAGRRLVFVRIGSLYFVRYPTRRAARAVTRLQRAAAGPGARIDDAIS